jgi:hypothetical protein
MCYLLLGGISNGQYSNGKLSKAKGNNGISNNEQHELRRRWLTNQVVDPTWLRTLPSPSQATTSRMKHFDKGQMQSLTSSPERSTAHPSVLSSSPPPLISRDQDRAEDFKSNAGKVPERHLLAEMMGVDYTDRVRKTYLRGKVQKYVLRFIDMSKPFSKYSYAGVMYPIIKGCTTYMNREVLEKSQAPWTRTIMQHVIHSVIKDTRRNSGAREGSAKRRKENRELAVSLGRIQLLALLTDFY